VSNYTKATNFATKDALLTGNPAKIIKGTEIDDEYNAIAVAVSTKADLNSPTFTGTPAAPTASGSTNTTQIATTAFVQSAITAAVTATLAAAYPVGSIYTNATNSTNPGTLLGFGTWTAFGAGRVMVGFDSTDALFDSAEETGGSKDAVVVDHTHTGTVASKTITGSFKVGGPNQAPDGTVFTAGTDTGQRPGLDFNSGSQHQINFDATHDHTMSVNSTGSSATNANIQPYITVYLWKRTA
jgi:hypothetical protein